MTLPNPESMPVLHIQADDLCGPEIATMLQAHLLDMYANSPAESVHALDLDKLRQPGISFWTIWHGDKLAGCGALKTLEPGHGEIKSMRTASTFRRSGVARQMLEHIIITARNRGYQRLSLETGSMAFFAPARAMYSARGFTECGPFADYQEDPHSMFMTLLLNDPVVE